MGMHTPGPWVVEATAVGTIETESGIAIAQAFQVKPLRQDLKQTERQANARLMAAAPEMLDALKQAYYRNEFGFLPDSVQNQIRSAINRAIGGEA